MEIVANKKAPRSQSLATLSVRGQRRVFSISKLKKEKKLWEVIEQTKK